MLKGSRVSNHLLRLGLCIHRNGRLTVDISQKEESMHFQCIEGSKEPEIRVTDTAEEDRHHV